MRPRSTPPESGSSLAASQSSMQPECAFADDDDRELVWERRLTSSQLRVLEVLAGRSMTTVAVAQAVDGRVPTVQKSLDALFRRSLVTVAPDGWWVLTERGRRKVTG